jgi:hypothetical protein
MAVTASGTVPPKRAVRSAPFVMSFWEVSAASSIENP